MNRSYRLILACLLLSLLILGLLLYFFKNQSSNSPLVFQKVAPPTYSSIEGTKKPIKNLQVSFSKKEQWLFEKFEGTQFGTNFLVLGVRNLKRDIPNPLSHAPFGAPKDFVKKLYEAYPTPFVYASFLDSQNKNNRPPIYSSSAISKACVGFRHFRSVLLGNSSQNELPSCLREWWLAPDAYAISSTLSILNILYSTYQPHSRLMLLSQTQGKWNSRKDLGLDALDFMNEERTKILPSLSSKSKLSEERKMKRIEEERGINPLLLGSDACKKGDCSVTLLQNLWAFEEKNLGRPSPSWAILFDDFYSLLARSCDFASKTEGYFDPTLGRVVNYWGFGPGKPKDVSRSSKEKKEDIKKLLGATGCQHIHFDKKQHRIKKDTDALFDLSGVAKGYATEKVSFILFKRGLANSLVSIGGENCIRGVKKHGVPWRVGIEMPSRSSFSSAPITQRIGKIQKQGAIFCTAGSGNYRNYRIEKGIRLSHEINPNTGFPVKHRLAAVHVLFEGKGSGAKADAYATALMAMGEKKGFAFAKANHIAARFIIQKQGAKDALPQFQVEQTKRWAQYVLE